MRLTMSAVRCARTWRRLAGLLALSLAACAGTPAPEPPRAAPSESTYMRTRDVRRLFEAQASTMNVEDTPTGTVVLKRSGRVKELLDAGGRSILAQVRVTERRTWWGARRAVLHDVPAQPVTILLAKGSKERRISVTVVAEKEVEVK